MVVISFCLENYIIIIIIIFLDPNWKIEEFLAHSGNVNCLSIGKKACRHFITGGDDHKVNVWAIGKPTAITVIRFNVSLFFYFWVSKTFISSVNLHFYLGICVFHVLF